MIALMSLLLLLTVLLQANLHEACSSGSVSIIGSGTDYYGHVQICHNNITHVLCENSMLWNVNAATVLCRSLNFTGAGVRLRRSRGTYAQPSIRMITNTCTGNESNLFDCVTFSMMVPMCPRNQYSTVLCSSNDPLLPYSNGQVKLIHSPPSYPNMGIVSIYYNGTFGTVCRRSFATKEATVVCNELGYGEGVPVSSDKFISDNTKLSNLIVFLGSVSCGDNDRNLSLCSHMFSPDNCYTAESVAVICTVNDSQCSPSGAIRVVDGDIPGVDVAGRMEVCLGGSWGSICNDGWTDTSADYICKNLNMNYTGISSSIGQFLPGTGPIWSSMLDCGNQMVIMDFLQPSLFMCQWRPIITSIGDCDHSDDVGVICYSNIAVEVKCLNGLENIYILDGILPNMGRVEVCGSDGQLHSICDDRYWSDPDATVICRQLGYTGIGYAVSGSYFSPNHRSPLFTKSICSGYETNYRDCPRVPADGSCQVIPNAGIVCYNGGSTACNDGEVMLTSSMNVSENLIELVMICFGGVWGHVCPNVWSEANAVVICRQNLLPYGWVQAKPIDISYETSDDILWLSDVQCSGSESRLVDCSRSILGIKRANCSLMGFAGVTCGREAPCVNGAFRLVPESSQVQSSVDRGRLETCVDTMWLTVCQEMFDITAGGIICNKIGFNNHSPTILTISDISPGLGHIAIITSNCTSPESSTCDIIVTVDEANVCSHINDIGLDCSTTTIESTSYIVIPMAAVILIIVSCGVIMTLCCVTCVIIKRKLKKLKTYSSRSHDHTENYDVFDETILNNLSRRTLQKCQTPPPPYYSKSATGSLSRFRFDSSKGISVSTEHLDELSHDIIIPWDNIALLGIIGKGEFGVVYKGHLMSPLTKSKPKVVAVKTLKGDFDQEDVNDLMEESIKMRAFQHPNVLGLVGVSIDLDSVPYIVLPYMANGNLLEWLKRERGRIIISYETTNEDELLDMKRELLSACYQIAKGMEYLASRKFVHRDLAARNCMMDETNLLKVSDFGLSQCVSEKNYLRMTEVEDTKLPIKWMAIESISGAIFSEMSDVWSFGVTCWEVFSGGKVPYSGVSPVTVPHLLEKGDRLSKPVNDACSDDVFDIMMKCWLKNPNQRPTFAKLTSMFDDLLTPLANYLDFNDINMPSMSLKSTVTAPLNATLTRSNAQNN